jgi:hypothetical protein
MIIPSCVKMGSVQQDEIKLTYPLVSNTTKLYPGPITGMLYPDEETLGIFSYHSEEPSGEWTGSSDDISAFINGAEFKYKPEYAAWAGWGGSDYTPYFWPSRGSLIFAGYSPYRYVNGTPIPDVSFDVKNKELSIEGFQTETYIPMSKADIENPDVNYRNKTQSDLSYFLPDFGINGNYSGVNHLDKYRPVMNHALSLVVFKVYAANESDIDYIDLNNITLHSVYHTGDFKVRMNGTSAGQTHWDLTDESPADMNVFDAGLDEGGNPDGLRLDTDPRTIAEILIIPGVTHDITIKYRLHVNGRIVTENKTISPTDIDTDPDPDVVDYLDEWEIGKRYVYNICLGVDFMSVVPSVSAWSENIIN